MRSTLISDQTPESSFDRYKTAAEEAYHQRPLSSSEARLNKMMASLGIAAPPRVKSELALQPIPAMHQWLVENIGPKPDVTEIFPGVGLITVPMLMDRVLRSLRHIDRKDVWQETVKAATTSLGVDGLEQVTMELGQKTPKGDLQRMCEGREVVLIQCNLHLNQAGVAEINWNIGLKSLLSLIGTNESVWVLNAVGDEGYKNHIDGLNRGLTDQWNLDLFSERKAGG